MPSVAITRTWAVQVVVGLAVGIVIAATDNFASGGEVSPIVIVAMLFAATAIAGAFWRWRAWIAALSISACVPAAHLVKHRLGLPDTLHPNTYASILKLAALCLAVATVGTACGVLIGGLTGTAVSGGVKRD